MRPGDKVSINPRSDKSRKLRVTGLIKSILSRNANHPHGVLVELESGEIGRVKSGEKSNSKPHEETSRHETNIDLQNIAYLSEDQFLELKKDLLWSSSFKKSDIDAYRGSSKEVYKYGKVASVYIIAQSIAAFLNSKGGNLILGILENKETGVNEITGIENDLSKLKDKTIDGYRRRITNLTKTYFPSFVHSNFADYITIEFPKLSNHTICWIKIKPSPKQVFLSINKEEQFFLRIDAEKEMLSGTRLVEYIQTRF